MNNPHYSLLNLTIYLTFNHSPLPLLHDVSYFARTNFRNTKQLFGILQSDRLFHIYTFGKTGSGKTTLLKTLMEQDLAFGRGFTFIDIHGDSSRELMHKVKQLYYDKPVIYMDITDPKLDFGYNPLRYVSASKRSLVASNILEIFQRNWKSAWGMKMEHLLRMFLLTLLDQPKANLSDILRLIHDKSFRDSCIPHIENEEIITFWKSEFPKYKPNDLLPIMNKVGALLSHRIIKRILVENKRQLSFRQAMDKGHNIIINLSKGAVGTDVAHIIGGLLLTSFASAGFSRVDTIESQRKPHFLYLDEFQALSGGDLIGEMLAQIRKFKIGMVLSNQFLYQVPIELRSAILGNAGTIICFRLGVNDAKLMAQEFYPVFTTEDFTSLANYSIYLRLMIHGKPSKPFSADTVL